MHRIVRIPRETLLTRNVFTVNCTGFKLVGVWSILTLMMQAGSVMKPGRIEYKKRYYDFLFGNATILCIIKINQSIAQLHAAQFEMYQIISDNHV